MAEVIAYARRADHVWLVLTPSAALQNGLVFQRHAVRHGCNLLLRQQQGPRLPGGIEAFLGHQGERRTTMHVIGQAFFVLEPHPCSKYASKFCPKS
jgi:hypothetical protein